VVGRVLLHWEHELGYDRDGLLWSLSEGVEEQLPQSTSRDQRAPCAVACLFGADRVRSLVYEVTRRGVSAMPTYEFRCEKCRKGFSRVEAISQHGKKRPKCPKCGSVKVMQVFSSFFAKTGKKS
jgi:putative FmdB family regulatory protein